MRTTLLHPHALPAFMLCTLPLLLYGVLCGSTGHDDSHISFWQAQTLLDHGQLLNYNGERIEQSSSLLLVLLTALTATVTQVSVVDCGYLLNLGAALLCLWLVWRLALQTQLPRPWLPVLLISLTPYFSYWAYSGMESTLAAACVMLMITAIPQWLQHGSPMRSALLFLSALALAAVRPEMVIVGPLFLFFAAMLLRRPALIVFALAFLLISLWRHYYFGVWFPNPVYAKSSDPGVAQLLIGWQYFLRLFRQPLNAAVTLCALMLFLLSSFQLRKIFTQPLLLLCGLWVLLYTGFVLGSGGDWMKEGRFWVPLLAPFWLYLCTMFANGKPDIALRYGIVALLVAYTPVFIRTYNFGTPLWSHGQQRHISGADASFFEMASREHLRDWPALRALQNLLRHTPQDDARRLTLLSKQMGMVNFHLQREFSNRLRVLDMAGLTDNTLRKCEVMAQDGYDRQGMRINYRKFFDRLPQAEKDCGLQAPDIIYDIYGWGETTPLPDYLAGLGYTIVFKQTGRVNMQPGMDITAQEMIAVRSTLLAQRSVAIQTLDFNQALTQ